jgi:hypothetical protein
MLRTRGFTPVAPRGCEMLMLCMVIRKVLSRSARYTPLLGNKRRPSTRIRFAHSRVCGNEGVILFASAYGDPDEP